LVAAAVFATAAMACPREGPQETADVELRAIEEVLAERTPVWMDVPGVVGTGIGLCEGAPCIVVYVSARTPEVERAIPAEVEHHRVRIEETGPIRALEP
jgi:hypothetical protein